MTRALTILVVAVLIASGCGKKKTPPPAPPAATQSTPTKPVEPTPTKTRAPQGIPQEFFDLVNEKWPEAEAEGKLFLAKFDEASAARKADDRAKLQVAIEEARGHFEKAADLWAEIAYWHQNQLDDDKIDDDTFDRCEKYIRTQSKTVSDWKSKAKGLKELSTVK